MDESTLNNLITRCLDGDSDSCLIVGDHYLEEVKDLQKSLEFFKVCQKLNHKDGNRRVGYVYHLLNDFNNARINWTKAAEQNDIIAIENLGRIELENKNYLLAREYFFKAINLGSQKTLIYLGQLEIEEKNLDEAIEILTKALEFGQVGAHFELAQVYEIKNIEEMKRYHIFKGAGEGVGPCLSLAASICYHEKSYEEALEYLRQLEKFNNPTDIFFIAQIYELFENHLKARDYYQRAADLGDAWGAAKMGVYLASDSNEHEAMIYFEKACKGGHGGACLIVGTKYRDDMDYHQAKYYFDEAIKHQNSDALIERGEIAMIHGDYASARLDFAKAMEASVYRAYYCMGNLEMKFSNLDEALQYFLIAADNGITQSYYSIGYIYSEKSEPNKAVEYFEKSIEAGNIAGFNALGCLELRSGNLDKARDYFLKGIEKQDLFCNLNIADLEFELGDKSKGFEYLNPVLVSVHPHLVILAHEALIRFYEMVGDQDKKLNHEKILNFLKQEELRKSLPENQQ